MRKATTREKSHYLSELLGIYTIFLLCLIFGVNMLFRLNIEDSYSVALVSLLGMGVMLYFIGQSEDDDEKRYIVAVEECAACASLLSTSSQQEK